MITNSKEYAVSGDDRNQLLRKQRQEGAADGGQVEVVDLEEEAELEWRPAAH